MNYADILPDVLTLEETASYLRLPLEIVERQAVRGTLPGRRIEQTWRFLKTAIDEWLSSQDNRAILLHQAGALAEDERLTDLLSDIYTARGRIEPSIEVE